MTTKFYLRDKNSKQFTSISLYFQYNSNRLVYPTKQKIKPSNWNSSKCRSKSSYAGATELTTLLEKIEIDYDTGTIFIKFPDGNRPLV